MSREQDTSDVLCAILEGKDGELRRSQWRTAVMFLNNRNADQALVIKQFQESFQELLDAAEKAKKKRAVPQTEMFA